MILLPFLLIFIYYDFLGRYRGLCRSKMLWDCGGFLRDYYGEIPLLMGLIREEKRIKTKKRNTYETKTTVRKKEHEY